MLCRYKDRRNPHGITLGRRKECGAADVGDKHRNERGQSMMLLKEMLSSTRPPFFSVRVTVSSHQCFKACDRQYDSFTTPVTQALKHWWKDTLWSMSDLLLVITKKLWNRDPIVRHNISFHLQHVWHLVPFHIFFVMPATHSTGRQPLLFSQHL